MEVEADKVKEAYTARIISVGTSGGERKESPIKQAPNIDLFRKNRYGTNGNRGNLVSYQQKIGNNTRPPANIPLIVLLCHPPGTFAASVNGNRINANDVATRTRPIISSS